MSEDFTQQSSTLLTTRARTLRFSRAIRFKKYNKSSSPGRKATYKSITALKPPGPCYACIHNIHTVFRRRFTRYGRVFYTFYKISCPAEYEKRKITKVPSRNEKTDSIKRGPSASMRMSRLAINSSRKIWLVPLFMYRRGTRWSKWNKRVRRRLRRVQKRMSDFTKNINTFSYPAFETSVNVTLQWIACARV